MSDFEIEKRTLEGGWVEWRLVTQRPMVTPDFKLSGIEARLRIAHLFVSSAAGICDHMGVPQLSAALGDMWDLVERSLRR